MRLIAFYRIFHSGTYLTIDDDSAEPLYTKGDIVGGNFLYQDFQNLNWKIIVLSKHKWVRNAVVFATRY